MDQSGEKVSIDLKHLIETHERMATMEQKIQSIEETLKDINLAFEKIDQSIKNLSDKTLWRIIKFITVPLLVSGFVMTGAFLVKDKEVKIVQIEDK